MTRPITVEDEKSSKIFLNTYKLLHVHVQKLEKKLYKEDRHLKDDCVNYD